MFFQYCTYKPLFECPSGSKHYSEGSYRSNNASEPDTGKLLLSWGGRVTNSGFALVILWQQKELFRYQILNRLIIASTFEANLELWSMGGVMNE